MLSCVPWHWRAVTQAEGSAFFLQQQHFKKIWMMQGVLQTLNMTRMARTMTATVMVQKQAPPQMNRSEMK